MSPAFDIHELADSGAITGKQYEAAMRYRALWVAYTQPWLFRVTIPWGEHQTLTEPQHHLAYRFRQANDALYTPEQHHQRLVGQAVLHDVPCGEECLPWIRSALDELVAHFGETE
jgi:hypothetical protein